MDETTRQECSIEPGMIYNIVDQPLSIVMYVDAYRVSQQILVAVVTTKVWGVKYWIDIPTGFFYRKISLQILQ